MEHSVTEKDDILFGITINKMMEKILCDSLKISSEKFHLKTLELKKNYVKGIFRNFKGKQFWLREGMKNFERVAERKSGGDERIFWRELRAQEWG